MEYKPFNQTAILTECFIADVRQRHTTNVISLIWHNQTIDCYAIGCSIEYAFTHGVPLTR